MCGLIPLLFLLIIALGASFVIPEPVEAQTPEPIVSREVGFFAAGVDPATGGQPISTATYTVAATLCGQPRVTAGPTTINPTQARVDDPANPALQCLLASNASLLPSVPFGVGYRGAARARGANSVSAWSALSNSFSFAPPPPTPPAVPTGALVR